MCETLQFFVRCQWNDAIDKTIGLLDSEPIVTNEVIPTEVMEVVLVDHPSELLYFSPVCRSIALIMFKYQDAFPF